MRDTLSRTAWGTLMVLAVVAADGACGSVQTAPPARDAGAEAGGGSSDAGAAVEDAGAADAATRTDGGNSSGIAVSATIGALGIAPAASVSTILLRPFLAIPGASICNATTCLSNGGIRP
jgi:hypothetical protein